MFWNIGNLDAYLMGIVGPCRNAVCICGLLCWIRSDFGISNNISIPTMIEKFTWDELQRIAFEELNLTENEFWNMKPKEFYIERLENGLHNNSRIRRKQKRLKILIMGIILLIILLLIILNL